jgi:hypothetical protein
MKLNIQGTSANNAAIPYASQTEALINAGPVATIKSAAGEDITFFGGEDADLFVYFALPSSEWDTVEPEYVCECSYCMGGYDTDTHRMSFDDESKSCESETLMFRSAEVTELARMKADGRSFVSIAQNLEDHFATVCEVDFIVGLKTELSDDVIGFPLSGVLVREETDVIPDQHWTDEICGQHWAAK